MRVVRHGVTAGEPAGGLGGQRRRRDSEELGRACQVVGGQEASGGFEGSPCVGSEAGHVQAEGS